MSWAIWFFFWHIGLHLSCKNEIQNHSCHQIVTKIFFINFDKVSIYITTYSSYWYHRTLDIYFTYHIYEKLGDWTSGVKGDQSNISCLLFVTTAPHLLRKHSELIGQFELSSWFLFRHVGFHLTFVQSVIHSTFNRSKIILVVG